MVAEDTGTEKSGDRPPVPVESGASGSQVVSADPMVLPPESPSTQLQHTDYVARSMRGLGSIMAPTGAWEMGVANYEALAHELREEKQVSNSLSTRLEVARDEIANCPFASPFLQSIFLSQFVSRMLRTISRPSTSTAA